jgi:hypothetical protein
MVSFIDLGEERHNIEADHYIGILDLERTQDKGQILSSF